ncbi:MAG: ABC transporter ATP-binding protein [Nitrospirota bacterium]
MYDEVVIKAEGLSKKFCRNLKRSIFYGAIDVLRNMCNIPYDLGRLRSDEFWALSDVSFELKKGEVLGIIGLNGSGKSTLLRLLSGIFPPDKGKITVRGRVGSLIAVGAGFHPHMTGRENIFLNGTILGMTKQEITKKFDSIVEFAEIGEFLHAPVSTYSSGMRVRLGFAIAVHCEPDILLIDEVLSVGDLSFRNKSLRYMANLREKARGIIFISHNLEQVRVLCDRVIILDKGKIIYNGTTHEGCVHYEEVTREMRLQTIRRGNGSPDDNKLKSRQSSMEEIEFFDIGVCDNNNNKIDSVPMNGPLNVFCDIEVKHFIDGLYFGVGILNDELKPCIWVMSNDNNKAQFEAVKRGKYRLLVKFPQHHLVPSVYIPNIAIRNNKTGETYERILPNCSFRVLSDGSRLERGIVAVKDEWAFQRLGNGGEGISGRESNS